MDLIRRFNNRYPNWSIVVTRIMTEETGIEIFKATVTPDVDKPERNFTSYAKELTNSRDNALEVAQGRAVNNALILVLTD